MNFTALLAVAVSLTLLLYGPSCTPRPNPDELDKLGTIDMTIKGKAFHLWIADDSAEQTNGLMFVTADRMADLPSGAHRGMIFVFDYEHQLSFWMRNTIIPLDIAYLDSKGVVVNTHTMAPLDERPNQYPSGKPARYAIEVNAGVFMDLGLTTGDVVSIPKTVLKRTR